MKLHYNGAIKRKDGFYGDCELDDILKLDYEKVGNKKGYC